MFQLILVIYWRRRFENRSVFGGEMTQQWKNKKKTEVQAFTDKMDQRSCVLFKMLYLLFNVIYWSYYLSK